MVTCCDRGEAFAWSCAVLGGVRVEGVATTIGFLRCGIDDDDFLSDRLHTRWIETEMADAARGGT